MQKRDISLTQINKTNSKYSIFLLHGFGADETDLAPIGEHICDFNKWNVFTLGAPYILPFGGYAWYEINISDDGITRNVNEDYFESITDVNEIISKKAEISKTIISGFSQGGSISLAASLKESYLATIGWSTYLPTNILSTEEDCKTKDIFMSHGHNDPVLDFKLGFETYEWLIKSGSQPQFHEHNGVHEIDFSTIEKTKSFIEKLTM